MIEKKISVILKRVVVAFIYIYLFDCLFINKNLFIPINLINVLFIAIFGIKGILLLLVLIFL